MKKTITIIILFVTLTAFGQKNYTADKYFDNYAYYKAAKLYEQIYKKGDTSRLVIQRLADSYYYNNDSEASEKWYAKLFELYKKDSLEAENYFRFAQSLKNNGKYKLSDKILLEFRELSLEDSRGYQLIQKKDYFERFSKDKEIYSNVHNLSINTKYSDYGGFVANDKVLFSSTRPRVFNSDERKYTWNNQPFYDIYTSKMIIFDNEKGINFVDLENLKKVEGVNTKYHDANAIVTKDGKTMYFTRDDYDGKKLRSDKNRLSQLKIYKATLIDSTWSNVIELPFNNSEFSNRHPALSPDEKTLYYASDKPGGYGKTDIYKVAILENDTYGESINLGSKINTEGIEMFPYLSKDNILYFSSNGHIGLGGLDVFESKIKPDDTLSPVDNLGVPINSRKDDFSFYVNKKNKTGFFTSNRVGGKGDDDIYSFVVSERKLPPCMQRVTGVIRDAKFKVPLENARLIIENNEGIAIKDTIVGVDGKFTFELPCNKKYLAIASKEYYQPDQGAFETTSAVEVDLDLIFDLNIVEDFAYNERNELIIKIDPIYFDYDKSNIRPDASIELEKIITVMNKYPKIDIRSSSHTDARGRNSYNVALSDRRAKSTVKYIIKRGISSTRITGKGFGETQLTNDCVDNDKHTNRVKCSKEEHQANRRTEFVIIKM